MFDEHRPTSPRDSRRVIALSMDQCEGGSIMLIVNWQCCLCQDYTEQFSKSLGLHPKLQPTHSCKFETSMSYTSISWHFTRVVIANNFKYLDSSYILNL